MVLLAFATLNHCPLVHDGVTSPTSSRRRPTPGSRSCRPTSSRSRVARDGQTYDQLADALATSGLECYDIAGLNISGSDGATQAEADESCRSRSRSAVSG